MHLTFQSEEIKLNSLGHAKGDKTKPSGAGITGKNAHLPLGSFCHPSLERDALFPFLPDPRCIASVSL